MRPRVRLALLVAIGAAFVAAYLAGLGRALEPERLRALVDEAGIWGPVVFVALFALLEALGVPGVIFMLAAATLWSPVPAFLLSWVGGIGAGIVGFALARSLGREWVAERLPERVRSFEQRVGSRGFQAVVAIRLVFFLFPPAHWALGLSPIGFAPYVAGTAIGIAPGVALWTFGGGTAMDWLSRQPPWTWLVAASLVVALVVARRHRALPGPVSPRRS